MFDLEKNIKNCYKNLKVKYDFSILSPYDIIKLTLEWDQNNALKYAEEYLEAKKKREEEEKEKMASREDYIEEMDENGRIWYKETHFYQQRDESRKLKPGDIIKYKGSVPYCKGIETGIMIVKSFDFKSDFAARGYFGIYTCEPKDGSTYDSYNSDYVPCNNAFSFATDEEIKEFFKTIKEKYPKEYQIMFVENGIWKPKYIEEKYSQYI